MNILLESIYKASQLDLDLFAHSHWSYLNNLGTFYKKNRNLSYICIYLGISNRLIE